MGCGTLGHSLQHVQCHTGLAGSREPARLHVDLFRKGKLEKACPEHKTVIAPYMDIVRVPFKVLFVKAPCYFGGLKRDPNTSANYP